jgi:hypothetical protein
MIDSTTAMVNRSDVERLLLIGRSPRFSRQSFDVVLEPRVGLRMDREILNRKPLFSRPSDDGR